MLKKIKIEKNPKINFETRRNFFLVSNNGNKKSIIKDKSITNIEEKIDKLFSEKFENKNKLNKNELNLEKISLKNRKENAIYYLKKRTKNKQNFHNFDALKTKVTIYQNKKTNNKKINKNIEKKEEFSSSKNKNIDKNHINFDKEKNFNKKLNNFKKNANVVKQNNLDEIISKIENEIDKIQIDTTTDKRKKIFRNEKLKYKIEKEIDWISRSTGNLFELKKSENQKILMAEPFEKKEKVFQESFETFEPLDEVGKIEGKRLFSVKGFKGKEKTIKEEKEEDKLIKPRPRRLFFKPKKITEGEQVSVEEIKPLVEKITFEESYDKDAGIVDEKIVKSEEVVTEKKLEVNPEIKAAKLVEEHLKNVSPIPSVEKKPDKVLDKKDVVPVLTEAKKPRFFLKKRKVVEKGVEKPEPLDEVGKIEGKRLFSVKGFKGKEKTIKEEKEEDKLIKPKPIKLFFKPKKSSEPKSTYEELNKTISKPVFHVEKIILDEHSNEDAGIVDEKIVKSEEVVTEKKLEVNPEIKAAKLVEEHLKNVSPIPSVEKEPDKVLDKKDVVPVLTEAKELEEEHVFLDEDSKNVGWSPYIIEKEKNKESEILKSESGIGLNEKLEDIELPKQVLSNVGFNLEELGFSQDEWEELDFYALSEPFAYVEILRQRESLDKCYYLIEMALTEEEENLLAFIQDTLATISIDAEEMEIKGEEGYLIEKLNHVINEYNIKISDECKKKLFYYLSKSSLGLGKITPLMKDPNIEDISCDGSGVPVFLYHRKFGSLKSNIKFADEDELSSFIFKLAQKCGKHISIAEPMLDATMPDGSRIQMTLSDEITAKGSTFTIRKFRADPFSPTDLIEFNTMSSEMIAYMWLAVENGINTLFAGGTASGKTTTLNAVMLFIPREAKIVSIEETREINLPHPNWIPGVSRSGFGEVVANKVVGEIDTYDLMKAALRQRPDYIIVGEIRGKEAYVLFQAMATGHATYSTAHADSAQSLIHRLEGKPINIPRIMLQSLDLICIHITTRVKNMRARRCKQIIEIVDIDPTTKEILTNEVFRWDPVEDKFIYSGKSYVLEKIRAEKDLTREQMNQELRNRKKIVEWMNANNIRGFKEVANIVSKYAETPNELLEKIEKDESK